MNLNKIKLLLCLDICLYIVAVCIVLVYIWKMFNMEFIIKYFRKTLYIYGDSFVKSYNILYFSLFSLPVMTRSDISVLCLPHSLRLPPQL